MAKRDLGASLHALVGAVIVVLFAGGYLREALWDGHGWSLTLHQWIEAVSWGLGGLVAAFFVWPMVRRFRKS